MQTEPQDLTFMDVLRRYRDVFLMLPRAVKWYWAARLKTQVIVSVAVLLCAAAVVVTIGFQRKPAWRDALARHVTQPLRARQAARQAARAPMTGGPIVKDPAIARSIAAGVSNRLVYVDSYHGSSPASLLALKDVGVNAFVFTGNLVTGRNDLFRTGVMVMVYEQHKPEPTEEEYDIIRTYIANGGRLMLLCPAWVWVVYEKKPLDRLPYNRIAAEFGVTMENQQAAAPLKFVHSAFAVEGVEAQLGGTFASILYRRDAYPILVGGNGKVGALAAKKGDSRMILWAHDNLLHDQVMQTPGGKALIKRAFDALLNEGVNLADGKRPAPAAAVAAPGPVRAAGGPLVDPEIARSIAAGVSNRVVYVDGYHAVVPPDLAVFAEAGAKATPQGYQGFAYNRDELFKSGLLVMQYGMNQREPDAEEYAVVRQYIANGGRLLLMCPAWVWDTYEHKPLEELPYNIIAREFGLGMDTSCVKAPMRVVHPGFDFGGFQKEIEGSFSSISFNPANATPILAGSDGKVAAIAATSGNARLVLWAHDNLIAEKTVQNPKGRKVVVQMVNWLLE